MSELSLRTRGALNEGVRLCFSIYENEAVGKGYMLKNLLMSFRIFEVGCLVLL